MCFWKRPTVRRLALPINSIKDKAVTERTLLASEEGDVFGVTTEIKQSFRVLVGEASRRAVCGKSARTVR